MVAVCRIVCADEPASQQGVRRVRYRKRQQRGPTPPGCCHDTPPRRSWRSDLAGRFAPLLLAVALVAAALSVSGVPPASADHGRDTEVWSATLTAGSTGAELGFQQSSSTGALSDTDFTHAGVNYAVRELTLAQDGQLFFILNRSPVNLKSPALTLHVGSAQFPLGKFGDFGANGLNYLDSGLSLTANQQVPVKLVHSPWTGVDLYGGGMVHHSDGAQTLDITSESGSNTFMVRLDQAPTANVTVTLQKNFTQCFGCGDEYHGDVNAVTVSPTTLTFTPSNYSTGQSVTVTGVADSDSVHDHVLILANVSIASGANSDDPYRNPHRVNGVWVTVHDGSDDGSSHGGL